MTEPILDPYYWKRRLEKAPTGQEHQAVFKCTSQLWKDIENKHREILSGLIKPVDSIIDVGCGWGRLINMLPITWGGPYLGIDLSPDFIRLAQSIYGHIPHCKFMCLDMRKLEEIHTGFKPNVFDWAILISIRPMIIRNIGREEWDKIERGLRLVAKKILYLEYDPNDNGTIENCC